MRLKTQLAGVEHDLSLKLDDGAASVEIDGQRRELEIREPSKGTYLLIEGTKVYHCAVELAPGYKDKFLVTLHGRSYEVTLIDPKRLRSGQALGAHDHGSAEIISPMPGKVVRVLCEVGTQVDAGAGVIVVEAMKMQNEMKSPKSGVVVSINAKAGATVNAGDVLAVVE